MITTDLGPTGWVAENSPDASCVCMPAQIVENADASTKSLRPVAPLHLGLLGSLMRLSIIARNAASAQIPGQQRHMARRRWLSVAPLSRYAIRQAEPSCNPWRPGGAATTRPCWLDPEVEENRCGPGDSVARAAIRIAGGNRLVKVTSPSTLGIRDQQHEVARVRAVDGSAWRTCREGDDETLWYRRRIGCVSNRLWPGDPAN